MTTVRPPTALTYMGRRLQEPSAGNYQRFGAKRAFSEHDMTLPTLVSMSLDVLYSAPV